MRAFLKNHRHAPRKIRLIARAVIGKQVSTARFELSMMPHKGAKTLEKLIRSAVANAVQKDATLTEEDLMIENITVDKGITFVRHMPRAFGRATPLRKECSHIRVMLTRKEENTPTQKTEKPADKKVKETEHVSTKADGKIDKPQKEEKAKSGTKETENEKKVTK